MILPVKDTGQFRNIKNMFSPLDKGTIFHCFSRDVFTLSDAHSFPHDVDPHSEKDLRG